MKNLFKLSIVALLFCTFASCWEKQPAKSEMSGFAKGADISWITEMEKAGRKFYTADGVETECFALMKQLGMNSIRLRVWVNPVAHGNYCNAADLLVKAKRANDLGMRLMIDFHYSDWWADPGKQNIPAAWKDYDLEQMKTAVTEHTKEVLLLLKQNKITPEWVQVGNETPDGMLWEMGRASTNMANYAQLNNAGYDAAKEIFPDTKVIVHIDNGYDNDRFRRIFDGLKANDGKWDVIGMSLYPYWAAQNNGYESWKEVNDACIANINDLTARYNTPVIIAEVGMDWRESENAKAFLSDLITRTKAIPDNKVLGVFYWEPEAYNWVGYQLGAFDLQGKPTIAMDAFK